MFKTGMCNHVFEVKQRKTARKRQVLNLQEFVAEIIANVQEKE